eukprot:gene44017-55471_t
MLLTGALAAFGTAPVPSASLFMLAAMLSAVGVSPEQTALIVGLVLPFDRLLDMTRTTPSVSANLTVATLVARRTGALDTADGALMNLRHIEIFHAVYVNGSVSAAARALNVSQPSVSKTLRHAESLLGFELFQRIAGRMVPTEDAHAMFGDVAEIQERVRALREAGRNLRTGGGATLRISALPSL